MERNYDYKTPMFMCWWEENIGLYTEKELYEQYKETNLYDDMQGIYWVGLGNGEQFRYFQEVLDYLKDDEDEIRNCEFICDNMKIMRVI